MPLFETLDALRSAGKILDRLLSIPLYRPLMEDNLEVMIGYSDSAKEAGFLTAGWELYKAQEDILTICRKHEVEFTIFHGRGGTTGRGGGPAYHAILALPPGSVNGRFHVTEQGEVIQSKYGIPDIAVRTFELYTSAVLEATLRPPKKPLPAWRERMENLSRRALAHYRHVVYETPEFQRYFQASTPVEELKHLNIGSRPPRRGTGLGILALRAIPWNFAWTQTRLMLPTWLGLGEAFQEDLAKEGTKNLQNMYHEWPFFRSIVDLVEMALAKADTYIAAQYDEILVPREFQPLGENLRTKLIDSVKTIKNMTGHHVLLETNPVLRRSIDVRNPYVDPINVVQMELLRRLRLNPDDAQLQYALMITVNGIAAGLRNTG